MSFSQAHKLMDTTKANFGVNPYHLVKRKFEERWKARSSCKVRVLVR